MKTCLVLVLCCAAIGSVICARDPVRENLRRRVAMNCIKDTKIKYATVRNFKSGDFSDDSDKAKCFLKCYGAKVGMFADDENDTYDINQDFIESYLDDLVLDKELIPKIVDKCKTADRGENVCDYAFNAYHCFYKEVGDKPEIFDQNDTLDAVLGAKLNAKFGFGLENASQELIEKIIAEILD